ncbi:MAG: alpha/beta hydrolase, partial [Alphaproteobacteria bacterium]
MLPEYYGLEQFKDLVAISKDGKRIQFWYRQARTGYPTIVYFHGNAANLGNRARSYHSFVEQGFGILALSYRGYGKSEGEPSEQGIYHDARAVIGYALSELRLSRSRLIYYGESLGSGVAVQMATEVAPGAIVLEAPYTSVAARAAEIYFYVPVRLLIKDRFESLKKIKRVTSPLLIFHGEKDTTIPAQHGRAILAAANDPKDAVFFVDRGHNDFDREAISAHVLDFATKHGLINLQ